MGIGYQSVDRWAYDYDLWFADEGRLAFRGPEADLRQSGHVTFIGAAQTFGRFVDRPFPEMFRPFSKLPIANLGISGAGPERYLNDPFLPEVLSRSRYVFIQAMSGRSVSAGAFRVANNNGVSIFQDGPRKGEQHLAQDAYRILRTEYGEDRYQEQVRGAQQAWIERYVELIEACEGRACILWVSERPVESDLALDRSPVGVFPHFVDANCVRAVQERCNVPVIECVLPVMKADPIVNRFTGELEAAFTPERFPNRPNHTRALNTYYATRKLHEVVFSHLMKFVSQSPELAADLLL